jgi:Fic family protein
MYIHELSDWTRFRWDMPKIALKVAGIRHRQGRLVGKMLALGFGYRDEAVLQTLTEEVLKTSEIEGEILNKDQVRSSLARRLGVDVGGVIPTDRQVDGIVEMMVDATQNYKMNLTKERLFAWHSALFPTGRNGLHKIIVGNWRDDSVGPMRVISGPMGKERIHYVAPAAERLDVEMDRFLAWFNAPPQSDLVIHAAIAHLWFVSIHPFEDGNGRIARAVGELVLARSDDSANRFYSMSAQTRIERREYYNILEATQKGDMEVTSWMEWFMDCLDRSFQQSEILLARVLAKAKFWEAMANQSINERQRRLLNLMMDQSIDKFTTSKWARIAKCSQDTAYRDIVDLVDREILVMDAAGGRSSSYSLSPAMLTKINV